MKTCGIINPTTTNFDGRTSSFFEYVQKDVLDILRYLVPKYGYDIILTSPDNSRFDRNVFLAARKYKATVKPNLLVMACLHTAPNKTSRLYTPLNTIVTDTDTPEDNQRKLIDLCDELLVLATPKDLKESTGPAKTAVLYAQKRQVTVRTILYATENGVLRLHF
ncbi:MAG: hypothetical protein HDQ88_07820 [Clostridia bacterium]|nr:hypothetical protein [Clostridia bacterium]